MAKKVNHFLDTSILRPLVTSSSAYKRHLESEIPADSISVARYVEMEYVRGFVINCMRFYGLVVNPTTNGYGDALMIWSNQYQSRSVKAVLAMAGSIFSSGGLSMDRNGQELHLAHYIRRLHSKCEDFKNPGIDNNLCKRTSVVLDFRPSDANSSFMDFIGEFQDPSNSKKCSMNLFINKHASSFERIIKNENTKNAGFESVKAGVQDLVSKGKKLTCTRCSKIGDAIITILTPKDFQLEHTDKSFEVLASLLAKANNIHKSESAFSKEEEE